MSPLLAFGLAFIGLVLFATAQLWLGARIIKAERRGWGGAARAALICVLVSLPVSMLFGNSILADLANFLVGATVIQRVLVTTTWRALALSFALLLLNLALVFLATGASRLTLGAG